MYHVQNKSKFLRLYLIKGLESTVQNILMSLNILYELHMGIKKVRGILAKLVPKKEKLSPLKRPYAGCSGGFHSP